MKYLNYFDVPDEELKSKDAKEYLNTIYKKIKAPRGKITSMQILPHEEKGMRRICAIYEVDEKVKRAR
ncbi:MAG: hypothetical protein KAR08_08680 [Candidatus Heimdallarchaeota archaeon]|nr:hypothetical protein [Candidatus Heimdallarchaeota archaeon]